MDKRFSLSKRMKFEALTQGNKRTHWPTWLVSVKTEVGKGEMIAGLRNASGGRIRERTQFIEEVVEKPKELEFGKVANLTDEEEEKYVKALQAFISITSDIDSIVRMHLDSTLLIAYDSGGHIIKHKFTALAKAVAYDSIRSLRMAVTAASRVQQGLSESAEDYLIRFHITKLQAEQLGHPGSVPEMINEWNTSMGSALLCGFHADDRQNGDKLVEARAHSPGAGVRPLGRAIGKKPGD